MSRPPSPSSSATAAVRRSFQQPLSPLLALGLLVTAFFLLTLYTHTNHMITSMKQEHKLRLESTTYHSSQKRRKTHKRIHRTKTGDEVIEIVHQDAEEQTSAHAHENNNNNNKHSLLRTDKMNVTAEESWPAPRLTNASTIIIVLSARSHLELRQVIRETWGHGHDNVYFVIGQYCPVFRRQDLLDCENNNLPPMLNSTHHDEWYQKRMQLESQVLREEQEHYRDMLWTPSPESYRGLPHKLKESYHFVVTKLPHAKWIVKADDNVIVRVASLQRYLETTLQYTKPTIVGRFEYEGFVHRDGKWKETKYKNHIQYPPFPLGSCGHVVSRPVAEYISKNKHDLVEYQGEDTSLGIWMNESPLQVELLFSDSFQNDGNCDNPNSFVIGHDLSIEKIRKCYEIGDEVQPIAQY